jgi:prephenate dehydrogenase
MSDPDFFTGAKVVVFGLGLMGGSLAMGLHGRCGTLAAVDVNEDSRKLAMTLNLVDEISDNPSEVVQNADLIILATPVNTIISLIQKMPEWHTGAPIILDLGSTKTQICQAFSSLPDRFDVLGGHPMCGKEALGLENADPAIFKGAPFAFTRLTRTSSKAIEMAEQLAKILGAHPVWLDADTHDRWAAYTSHMPYLIASALALAAPAEVRPLVGPGLRSTTRLAGTPVSMMKDILTTNRVNILQSLNKFQLELDKIVDLLQQQEDQDLMDLMVNAAQCRNALIQDNFAGGL